MELAIRTISSAKTLHDHLCEIGFTQSNSVPCQYLHQSTAVQSLLRLKENIDQGLHQSAAGCLLSLSTWTRLDITFAMSNTAKYCLNPLREHWTAVKRILRYLKGTVDYGVL